jgi:virginiamycin B lyase
MSHRTFGVDERQKTIWGRPARRGVWRAGQDRKWKPARWRAVVEPLEERRLLASGVTAYPVPTPGGYPVAVSFGADGNLYFTEGHAGKIGWIDAQGKAHEVSIPSGALEPAGLTAGEYGQVVFTEADGHRIGVLDTASGGITEFSLPTPYAVPGAVADDVGDVWFAETVADPLVAPSQRVNKIGEFEPGGQILEFPLPAGSEADALTVGPDGNVWFVDGPDNAVGKITPAGAVTEYPIPTAASGPWEIALGSDGNLWFTESAAHKVGRLTPGGTFTEYALTTPGASPTALATGPDGMLWFTETTASGPRVGRISPAGGGVTEFVLPDGFVAPAAIAPWGPDAVALADPAGNLIGKVATEPGVGFETFTPSARQPQDLVQFAGFSDLSDPLVSFSTSVAHASPADFTATIDWGDGTAATPGTVELQPFFFGPVFPAVIPFRMGPYTEFSVSGSHTYAQPGTYTARVKVTDGFGLSTVLTHQVTVLSPPFGLVPQPVNTSVVGPSFPGDVLTVGRLYAPPGTSPDLSGDSVTIDWGDGTTTAGSLDPALFFFPLAAQPPIGYPGWPTGQLPIAFVTGKHHYTSPGDFTVTFTVTDTQHHAQTATTTAHVAADYVSLSPGYAWATAGSPVSGVGLANLAVADTAATPGGYAATIDWGDGTVSAGTLVPLAQPFGDGLAHFTIQGDHTYAHAGVYAYTVTVTRVGGGTLASTTGSITAQDPSQFQVASFAPLLYATTGQPFAGNLPSFTSYNPNATTADYTAVIDWGDGTQPTPGVVIRDPWFTSFSPTLGQTVFDVVGAHTFAHAGTYTAKVTITQRDGKTSQELAQVVVSDTPVILPPWPGPVPPPIVPPPIVPPPVVVSPPPTVPVTPLPQQIQQWFAAHHQLPARHTTATVPKTKTGHAHTPVKTVKHPTPPHPSFGKHAVTVRAPASAKHAGKGR